MKYGIHWFRRDLRIAGNSALQANWKENEGRVVGIFCFDENFLARADFSHNRFQFFLETLKELKKELKSVGSDLLVLGKPPEQTFPNLFHKMQQQGLQLPSLVTWNRDYEPFARNRDDHISKLMQQMGITQQDFRDHLLIEPKELTRKGTDEGYKVFTPFSRRWLEIFETKEIQQRIKNQKKSLEYYVYEPEKIFKLNWKKVLGNKLEFDDQLDHFSKQNEINVTVRIPKAGSLQAYEQLMAFKKKMKDYKKNRDFPTIAGTSRLSGFLKNGSLTIVQIIAALNLKYYKKGDPSGEACYFSELIWREFYYHVLYRFPRVEKTAFLDQYKNIRWHNNQDWFEKWKQGKTGFPIVDAGMRELNTTGFMHNRVRMIVASFLVKDLLIDWRWGEQYFMEKLLDGDLAANNGGWQWAASTGCDAQPYFRIFNPWSQSKKFDKDGDYIKKYVSELKDLPAKKLHEPILDHPNYPKPMVEHSEQREKALKLFKAL